MILKKYKYLFLALFTAMLGIIFTVLSAASELPPVVLNPDKVTKIELKSMPIKTQYLVGEKLDMSGAVLLLTYDNGDPGETVVKTEWCSGFDSSKAGKKTVTIKYEDTSCTTTFEVEVVKEERLEIVQPTTLMYFVGDKEDRTGLSVSVIYSNGQQVRLESGYTVSGFSSNTVGDKTITVKYKDLTATYKITVIEPALVSIRIASRPAKDIYFIGEKLNTAGIKVIAKYEDGSEKDVTKNIVIENDILSEGKNIITVVYSERNHIKKATFEVLVTKVQIFDVSLVKGPNKTVYYENERFDPTGIELKVIYNNNTSETVSGGSVLSSGFDSSTIGKKTVSLDYYGFKLDIEVEVRVSPSHVHKAGEYRVTKEPTCTETGNETAMCTVCFEPADLREMPAKGHGTQSDPIVTKEATCTESGVTTIFCMECREAVDTGFIFPNGHTEGEIRIDPAPGCTSAGKELTFCKVCGVEYGSAVIDPLGHNFSDWTLTAEPTGISEGEESRTCSVCSETEIRTVAKLDKILTDENIAAELNSADDYFMRGTSFEVNIITDSFSDENVLNNITENGYKILDVFELSFYNMNGEKYLPEGDITYSVSYTLPESGYSSYLIYDTDLGRYTPLTDPSGFSFTVQRCGRFVLVGEIEQETSEQDITSSPDAPGTSSDPGSDNIDVSAEPQRKGNSAIIMVLIIIAVMLLVIIAALVYTYVFKQYY